MNVSVTQENPILVKAEITVPWADVEDTFKKTLKDIKKHAQVPGFRKGKIPVGMLKKRYKPQIISELGQKAVPDGLAKAIEDNSIKAVGQPRILDIDYTEKENLYFVAEMDVLPEVELKDYKGLEADKLIIDITDEQVDEELARLIDRETKDEEIKDRPAKDGETLTLSVTAIDEDADETVTDLDNYVLNMGAEDAHPGLSKLVAGLKAEDEYAGVYEAADDDAFEDWRGKKVKLYLEVNKITASQKPELNDAFAKTQDAEDLEDLKVKTRNRLNETATEQEDARLDQVLVEQLMQSYDFPVPDSIVREEAMALTERQMMPYMQMMQQQGPAQQRAFMESMVEYSMPQAFGKVRADLVLAKIAEDLNVEVSEEQITEELEKLLEYTEHDKVEDLRAQMEERGSMDGMIEFIKRRHALEAVREAATLTMVDKLPEPEEAEHEHGPDCDHDHDGEGQDGDAPEAEAKSDDAEAPAEDAEAEAAKSE